VSVRGGGRACERDSEQTIGCEKDGSQSRAQVDISGANSNFELTAVLFGKVGVQVYVPTLFAKTVPLKIVWFNSCVDANKSMSARKLILFFVENGVLVGRLVDEGEFGLPVISDAN
jgi:hypothetical protein